MGVSAVVRLSSAALARGELTGEVELVTTGERRMVGSAEELLAVLQASVDGEVRSEHDLGPGEGGPA